MTDKCHGRLVIGGTLSPASNDHYDTDTNAPGTAMRGSPLAGPDPLPNGGSGGKYIAQSDGKFVIGAGQMPTNFPDGMGGLSSYYTDPLRQGFPNSMVGYVPMDKNGKIVVNNEDAKGVVFVACGIKGNGGVQEFYQAAKDSGVPEVSGATPSAGSPVIHLLFLDSGNTSCGLAHHNPSGNYHLEIPTRVVAGITASKHWGCPYYLNTFLRFKSQKPRD